MGIERQAVTRDSLNSVMEFDSVVYSHGDGTISNALGVYAPDVWEEGGELYCDLGDWEGVNGYSGQYGYGGPVMHPSEFLGGAMAEYVLENPGNYAMVVVRDEDDLDGEPAGWALMEYAPEA